MEQVKTVHRMWLGPHPMPDDYVEFGQEWKRLNPDWEVKDWTEDELLPALNQNVIDDLKHRDAGRKGVELYVQMADVLGYEVIYKYGGIYVNVDIQPVRSLEYMFEHYQPGDAAYAFWCDQEQLVNAVLGAPQPGHPAWQYVIARLPGYYMERRLEEMNHSTGPLFMSQCIKEKYGSLNGQPGQFVGLPVPAFNSVHFHQIPIGSDAHGRFTVTPDVIGVHHWGHRRVGRTNYVETATIPGT